MENKSSNKGRCIIIIYKEFTVRDLFTKKTMKGYPKSKENLTPNENGFYVYGQNIKHQYDFKILMDDVYLHEVNPNHPILAYTSSVGEIGLIEESFYRSGDNGAFQALIPKNKAISRYELQYILTVLKGQFETYGYATSMAHIIDLSFSLPATSKGEPDYEYMKNYMINLEKDHYLFISDFLNKTGLSNCELTDKEKELLSMKKDYKEFYIDNRNLGGLFKVKNTHSILKEWIKKTGNYPYVTASEGNNSIAGYVDFDTEQIEEGNCISIGGKTMVVTYQSKDYVSNDSHNLALYIDDIRGRTEKAQLFIVSAIKSALSHKYTWGDSISKSKIKSDKIMLPVTDSGNIDFEYMEEYITAIEKTVMGNVLNVINNETSTQ